MQTEILIAGAGLGGLSIAATLQRKGIDYLLCEARDRIGGRILTTEIRGPDDASCFADLGAAWIWPGQGLIAALLHDLEIGVFEQYSRGRMIYEDEQGEVRRDLNYASMAGSLRVDGGLARVTDRLAANLDKDRILLGHRVGSVRELEAGYRVGLVHGDGELRVEAGKVMLAIPPRLVAECIEFEPALDDTIAREMTSIPTWMAGHAKLHAVYREPFWRSAGLSGDAISRRGPLMEIHDASPANPGPGALFGFVGLAADSPAREPSRLIADALGQLESLYGPAAAKPLDVVLEDWARQAFTATPADRLISQHPRYGMPPGIAALAERGLLLASSEMAPQFGGFVEGALEAAQLALARL